jgi:uncharacterized protein (TIGR02996 family)
MDVEAALSKAILDEPEDLPRLAYADWLDERGGKGDAARAEFIRLQIEQARRQGEAAEEVRERSVALWQAHRSDWFGPAAERLSLSECVRGFLTGITVGTFVALVEEAGRSDEAWPLGPVPVVQVGGKVWEGFDESVDHLAVARRPDLASWGGIDCRTNCRDLLRGPHLTNLRSLSLASNLIERSDLEPLSRAAFRLRSLRFTGWQVSDGAMRLLAGAPSLHGLCEFDLASSPQTQAPVVEFLGSANAAALRRLTLRSSSWRHGWAKKATLQALVHSCRLTNLRSLALCSHRELLCKSGARKLANWKGLPRLNSLHLEGDVGLSNDGLRILTRSPHLAGLRELSLSCPALDYLILTESPHLDGLARLRLGKHVPVPARAALAAHFGGRVVFDA